MEPQERNTIASARASPTSTANGYPRITYALLGGWLLVSRKLCSKNEGILFWTKFQQSSKSDLRDAKAVKCFR
jgi:hypothetical protein